MSELTPAAPAQAVSVAETKKASASLRLSLAALAAGVFAGAVFPIDGPGIGVPLIALAIGGVVLFAERRQLRLEQLAWAVLGLALISMVAVRGGDWLLIFCLLAAAGLGSLAVGGGTTWREVIGGLFSVIGRLPKAFGFLIRPISRRLNETALERYAPAFRGVVIGAALLVLFGILFATADQAFSRLLRRVLVFLEWDWGQVPFRTFVVVATAVFTGAYALGFVASDAAAKPLAAPRRLGRTEWTIALTLLDLLFLAFVIVQFTVLFGGRDHVLRTEGLIYSEYARQGFFQLLVVGALTLAVIAGTVRWGDRTTPADRMWTKILLGLLCLFTLVVLASALKRLGLYESAFGLTRARVTAHALIFWLGGVFLMVIVAGSIWKAEWLAKTLIAYAAMALLVFALINPDRIIASHNLDRYRATGKLDIPYLESLGPDAIPVVARAPESIRACVFPFWITHLRDQQSWNEFNLSRDRARRIVLASGMDESTRCRLPISHLASD